MFSLIRTSKLDALNAQVETLSAELALMKSNVRMLEMATSASFDTLRGRVDQLEHRVGELDEELDTTLQSLRNTEAELDQALNGPLPNDGVPRVILKSTSHDPVSGIKLELDWNDEFIRYLKENGITGPDEETVVQKWLALIDRNIAEDLEAAALDSRTVPTIDLS